MKPNNVNTIDADVKKNIQTAAQLLQGLQFKLLSQEESAVWTVPSPEEVKDDLLEVLTSSLCSYRIWFRKHFSSFHFMKRAPTWCGVVLLWSLNEWPLHLLLSLSLIDLLFKEIKHFFFLVSSLQHSSATFQLMWHCAGSLRHYRFYAMIKSVRSSMQKIFADFQVSVRHVNGLHGLFSSSEHAAFTFLWFCIFTC